MADTNEILAQTRLALRRESSRWSKGGSDESGARIDPDETAPLVNRAAQIQDTSKLIGPQRFRAVKRIAMRLAAFYTTRQAWFNTTVVQVLKGNQRVIGALYRERQQLLVKLAEQDRLVEELRRDVAELKREAGSDGRRPRRAE